MGGPPVNRIITVIKGILPAN